VSGGTKYERRRRQRQLLRCRELTEKVFDLDGKYVWLNALPDKLRWGFLTFPVLCQVHIISQNESTPTLLLVSANGQNINLDLKLRHNISPAEDSAAVYETLKGAKFSPVNKIYRSTTLFHTLEYLKWRTHQKEFAL